MPCMYLWRLSLGSDFPQAFWLCFCLCLLFLCPPILLSDPALAFGAGEISEAFKGTRYVSTCQYSCSAFSVVLGRQVRL